MSGMTAEDFCDVFSRLICDDIQEVSTENLKERYTSRGELLLRVCTNTDPDFTHVDFVPVDKAAIKAELVRRAKLEIQGAKP